MSMSEGTYDPSRPRLRTAHDQRAMAGEVPWTLGGNPTPDEQRAQDEYERQYAERAARVAAQVDADTADVRADMVIMADGAIMSGRLAARGDRGWLFDEDRDSQVAAKLRELVGAMDDLVTSYRKGGLDMAQRAQVADTIADAWVSIRRITQGRDITEGNGS